MGASAAFCETFDGGLGDGGRAGGLGSVLWGVSRLGDVNPGGLINRVADVSVVGCGVSGGVAPSRDVRICGGQMFEAVNDGHGVANLDTYPKQPFDFSGRTGRVVFDVSADSEGSHAAWPEFVITDKPVPGVRAMISGVEPPGAANSVGFTIHGGCGDVSKTGVDGMFVTKNFVYSEPPLVVVDCVKRSVPGGPLNRFEVRVSQNRLEVWGGDPGSSVVKLLAVGDNLGLTLTRGLVWLNDVHYNASKGGTGSQTDHTFVWDNLGFDGPKTYRDLGFDVADGVVRDGNATHLGYSVGTSVKTFTVSGVNRVQAPTGAQLVLNTYSFQRVIPSVSVNGGPWIETAWPFVTEGNWRSISIPVPLDQVHDGTNTISLRSTDPSTTVANISLILVAGAPVP